MACRIRFSGIFRHSHHLVGGHSVSNFADADRRRVIRRTGRDGFVAGIEFRRCRCGHRRSIRLCIGRFGGRRLIAKIVERFGGADKIEKAKDFTNRWGGAGIFFSRWLITLLGPWINITSGATKYPWNWFLFWDIAGEICWVVLYVMLGKIFSDRVQEISDLTGNLTYVIFGIIVAAILGWKLFHVPAEK